MAGSHCHPFTAGTKAGDRTMGTQGLGSPAEKRDTEPRRKCDLCQTQAEGRRKHGFPFPGILQNGPVPPWLDPARS